MLSGSKEENPANLDNKPITAIWPASDEVWLRADWIFFRSVFVFGWYFVLEMVMFLWAGILSASPRSDCCCTTFSPLATASIFHHCLSCCQADSPGPSPQARLNQPDIHRDRLYTSPCSVTLTQECSGGSTHKISFSFSANRSNATLRKTKPSVLPRFNDLVSMF